MKKKLFLVLLFTLPLFSQDDGDTPITVPKRYLSQDALAHKIDPKTTGPQTVSQWVGVGKEIGVASHEALAAVVDEADKFGRTRVGNFVLLMVAWKVIGQDAVGLAHGVMVRVIGIPLLLLGWWAWWVSMRKFFFGARYLSKVDTINKTKEWAISSPYPFNKNDDDGKIGCAWAHGLAALLLLVAGLCIIF